MLNSPIGAHQALKPPQDHSVFYCELDFTNKRFKMVDQFEDIHDGGSPRVAMLHLSRCFKYQFYRVTLTEVGFEFSNKRICTDIRIDIKEEMSRNEFFSQYALGTLEGTFIATRDVEYLRKYLNHN